MRREDGGTRSLSETLDLSTTTQAVGRSAFDAGGVPEKTTVAKLTYLGWALLGAAALALLWILETGFPRSGTDAALAAYVVLGGSVGGILCWLAAAFLGPAPAWWRRPDGRRGSVAGLPLLTALVVVPVYFVLALPWLEDYSEPVPLLVGASCAAAALRAASPALAVPLGAAAAGLVAMGSGEASLLLGHGALAIAVAAVLGAAFEAGRSWVRALAGVTFVAGLLLWLYLGMIALFLYGCGTRGCFA